MPGDLRNLPRDIAMKKAPFPRTGRKNQAGSRGFPAAGRAAILVLALVLAAPAFGEFYKYVDESGQTHYVDDPSQIPQQKHEDVTKYREKFDDLPLPERLEKNEKESDLRNDRLNQARTWSGLGRHETRVEVVGNSVLVPVTLEYRGRKVTARMVLDTGAESMVIHTPLAQALGMDDGNLEPAYSRVAGGGVVEAGLGVLSAVEVGPNRKDGVQVLVVQYEGQSHYDGLLGMNFLKGLDYTVDFDNSLIRWRN